MNLSSPPIDDAWQQAVIQELAVPREFNVEAERERRVAFLGDYLASQGLRTYVLGISGGVDSSTAGRLAQLAVDRLRARGYEARFVAVRLPYGTIGTKKTPPGRLNSSVRTKRSRSISRTLQVRCCCRSNAAALNTSTTSTKISCSAT